MKRKILAAILALVALTMGLSACKSDADVASKNLSKAADNYEVMRNIVVYNGITDKYIMTVTGYCALGNEDSADQVSYTCKSDAGLVKDIIKKSDNTFVFVHQIYPKGDVSTSYFRVVLKPSTVVPDFDLR